jgi:hypothetical protein
MVQGAHAIRAFGEGGRGRVSFVLRYASMVADVWCGRLLCMQCCCQGIDFAFEFGNAAVGLLLSLPRRGCGDALHSQRNVCWGMEGLVFTIGVRPLRIACTKCPVGPGRSAPA